MDSFVLTLIATSVFISIRADDEAQIEVYEIRKARDNPDLRLDFQYYDPHEGYRFDDDYKPKNRNNQRKRKLDLDAVTNNLIDKLKDIVHSKYRDSRNDDDYIATYKDIKDDNIFEDGKTPVVIIADKSVLYHLYPQKLRSVQNKGQTVLRSVNLQNDVEDRTAPPRVINAFEYDYE